MLRRSISVDNEINGTIQDGIDPFDSQTFIDLNPPTRSSRIRERTRTNSFGSRGTFESTQNNISEVGSQAILNSNNVMPLDLMSSIHIRISEHRRRLNAAQNMLENFDDNLTLINNLVFEPNLSYASYLSNYNTIDFTNITSILAALNSKNNTDNLNILIRLNKAILMNSNNSNMAIVLYKIFNTLNCIINDKSRSDLWVICTQVFRSILDVNPQMIDTLMKVSSRLNHFIKCSPDTELIEACIDVVYLLVKNNPRCMIKKNIMKKLLRPIDFVSIAFQRTTFKIFNNCIENMKRKDFKYLKSCLLTISNRLNNMLDQICIQLTISFLYKSFTIIENNVQILTQIYKMECVSKLCDLYFNEFLPKKYISFLLQILSKICNIVPFITLHIVFEIKFINRLCQNLSRNSKIGLISMQDIISRPAVEMEHLIEFISNLYPPIPLNFQNNFYKTLIDSFYTDITYTDLGYSKNINVCYWEYLKLNKWQQFSTVPCEKIEEAYKFKVSPFALYVDGEAAKINFEKMQYSATSKSDLTPIRRVTYCKSEKLHLIQDDVRTKMLTEQLINENCFIVSLILAVAKSELVSPLTHKSLIIILKIVSQGDEAFINNLLSKTPIFREIGHLLLSSSFTVLATTFFIIKVLQEKLVFQFYYILLDEGVYSTLFKVFNTLFNPNIKCLNVCNNELIEKYIGTYLLTKDIKDIQSNMTISNWILKIKEYVVTKRKQCESNSSNTYNVNSSAFLYNQSCRLNFNSPHAQSLIFQLKQNVYYAYQSFVPQEQKVIMNKDLAKRCKFETVCEKIYMLEDNTPLRDNDMREIVSWFLPKNIKKLTPYRILESKIIDFMIQYLTKKETMRKNMIQFILNFIVNFENNCTTNPFSGLISVIQVFISYMETLRCPSISADFFPLSANEKYNILQTQITTAFKFNFLVNFHRHPDCTRLPLLEVKKIEFDSLKSIAFVKMFILSSLERKKRTSLEHNNIRNKKHMNSRAKLNDASEIRLNARLIDTSLEDVDEINHDINSIDIYHNGFPISKNITLLQAIISTTKSSNNSHDLTEPFTLSNIFFEQNITIYYKKATIERPKPFWHKFFGVKNIGTLDYHLSNMMTLKETLSYYKSYIGIDGLLHKAIKLLSILHYINYSWGSMIDRVAWEPAVERKTFVNKKISAKIGRTVSDDFMCLINAVPQWVPILTELCPFMIDFSVRTKLFYSMYYGIDRKLKNILREDPTFELPAEILFQHQIRTENLVVDRTQIFQEMIKYFKNKSDKKTNMAVTFKDEPGVGKGPTAEFFSLLSREFVTKNSIYWNIDNDLTENDVFTNNIFLKSCFSYNCNIATDEKKAQEYFINLGKFFGKVLIDKHQCDIAFSHLFYTHLLFPYSDPYLWTIKDTDPIIYKSIMYLLDCAKNNKADEIAQMDLTFTWSDSNGKSINLCHSGYKKHVTVDTVNDYVHCLINTLYKSGLSKPFKWIRSGMRHYLPHFVTYSLFFPEEFNLIISGRVHKQWNIEELERYVNVKAEYTVETPVIQNMFKIMSQFSSEEQRLFLIFTTSKARLPSEGFSELRPYLSIIPNYSSSKNSTDKIAHDNILPSSSTCSHCLKLPNYSTIEILKSKLMYAMVEGQGAFLIS